jgi:hypothetical protein
MSWHNLQNILFSLDSYLVGNPGEERAPTAELSKIVGPVGQNID